MKIIFLTLLDFTSYDEYNIYCDLLRELKKNGHDIYCISPVERKRNMETHLREDGHLLKLKIGNIQKTNVIEKGISTVLIERQFIYAIKKYFSDIKFDMILYSTPPITLVNAVKYIKKRDNAKTYLMLKDIFPQNAVDMNMLKKTGVKGILYKYFRRKEKNLYAISDRIGCMSKANVDYILEHNQELTKSKVEICPNCIEIQDIKMSADERKSMREKYGIPYNKKVFVYGGNLGRPQGIPFIIECLKTQLQNKEAFFLIVGEGTEFSKLQDFFDEMKPTNMKLMRRLSKEDYDRMIVACDVGMIFLDYRFTIPNFPSRLLSYMQAGLPILACTDKNTDIGKTITEGGFGWWCESKDVAEFKKIVIEICNMNEKMLGKSGQRYLADNYDVSKIACNLLSK